MNNKIKNVTIVGGGTAGWLAAGWLSKFNKNLKITLIESPTVSPIGVGEAVTPHVSIFFEKLGINEKDWMKHTGAVYKYANKFVNWTTNKKSEYSSFNYPLNSSVLLRDVDHGLDSNDFVTNEINTADTFMHLLATKKLDKFDKYFHSQFPYMENNVAPFDSTDYLLNKNYSWSQHINAELAAEYIRDNVAIPNGVVHIKANVVEIIKSQQGINKLILDNGNSNYSDFYIDASGFKRILASDLGWKFKEYKNHPIRSAWVAQTDYNNIESELVNYTQSIAEPFGWRFNIGLYHRMGNGYSYSPDHCSDNLAKEYFLNQLSNVTNTPRKLSWTPGRFETPLQGNVATIGLSIGFVEALEATSLLIITESIRELSEVLNNKKTIEEFNNHTNRKFDIIADFILVHYTLSDRSDTEFWKDMQDLGKKENHSDLVYEYFKKLKFGQGNVFPDFMWGQVAHGWGQNLDKWILDSKYNDLIELTYLHYNNSKCKHEIISKSRLTNYKWLSEHIYN